MEKFYQEFEDTEENKFSYTDIHKEYVSLRLVNLCAACNRLILLPRQIMY